MLPESGEISALDGYEELGGTGTPSGSQDWETFGLIFENSSPYNCNQWHGADYDWLVVGNAYLEVISYSIQGTPPTDYPRFTVDNHSQTNTQSETLYYKFMYMGSPTHTGSVATGTVSINSTKVVDGSGPFYSVPYDQVLVSYDNSHWIDIY
jgi:hypothetical protein